VHECSAVLDSETQPNAQRTDTEDNSERGALALGAVRHPWGVPRRRDVGPRDQHALSSTTEYMN